MTGNEMLSMLGLRLEDPDENNFTQAIKLDALNLAQKTVVNLIDNAYLTELEYHDGSVAVATDAGTGKKAADFADLNSAPIRNGIIAVFDETDSKFCTIITAKDLKRLQNSYLAASTDNPVAYVFAESIFVEPATITAIDVWYIREPNDLAADAVECEFNIALHELVVDFAEAQLWRAANQAERSATAKSNALDYIGILNQRYEAEKPRQLGVGG